MPSVGFCNLGDAYGDWGSKKSNVTNHEKNTDSHNGNPESEKKVSQQMIQKNVVSTNNDCPNCNKDLPNLPTFQNAEGCMVRNNRFQDGIAGNQFQIPSNPLNYGGPVNMNQINDMNLLSQSMMAPHMNFNNLPNNFNGSHERYPLPISNQQNTWPPQRWVVDPNGPTGYENYDPYNRPFTPRVSTQGPPGFYGQVPSGQIRENFGNQGLSDQVLEYFGARTGGPDKGSQLLQLVLFALVVLFFIQLVEIIISSQSSE